MNISVGGVIEIQTETASSCGSQIYRVQSFIKGHRESGVITSRVELAHIQWNNVL